MTPDEIHDAAQSLRAGILKSHLLHAMHSTPGPMTDDLLDHAVAGILTTFDYICELEAEAAQPRHAITVHRGEIEMEGLSPQMTDLLAQTDEMLSDDAARSLDELRESMGTMPRDQETDDELDDDEGGPIPAGPHQVTAGFAWVDEHAEFDAHNRDDSQAAKPETALAANPRPDHQQWGSAVQAAERCD